MAKETPMTQHNCGARGFNPMLGDICPACFKARCPKTYAYFGWPVPAHLLPEFNFARSLETALTESQAECDKQKHMAAHWENLAAKYKTERDEDRAECAYWKDRFAKVEAECERLRRDAERYAFLKSRIEVPGAVHHFLALNNWHPDTDLRDVDAAIDAASAGIKDE